MNSRGDVWSLSFENDETPKSGIQSGIFSQRSTVHHVYCWHADAFGRSHPPSCFIHVCVRRLPSRDNRTLCVDLDVIRKGKSQKTTTRFFRGQTCCLQAPRAGSTIVPPWRRQWSMYRGQEWIIEWQRWTTAQTGDRPCWLPYFGWFIVVCVFFHFTTTTTWLKRNQ